MQKQGKYWHFVLILRFITKGSNTSGSVTPAKVYWNVPLATGV